MSQNKNYNYLFFMMLSLQAILISPKIFQYFLGVRRTILGVKAEKKVEDFIYLIGDFISATSKQ